MSSGDTEYALVRPEDCTVVLAVKAREGDRVPVADPWGRGSVWQTVVSVERGGLSVTLSTESAQATVPSESQVIIQRRDRRQ